MRMSPEINELAAALVAAQAELRNVQKDASNPFYKSKYADLPAIIDAIRPSLAAHDLAVSQVPSTGRDGIVTLTTLLIHKSGQFIGSTYPVTVAKVDPQGIGSGITYARRYALAAIVGITGTDDDDDAEGAHGRGDRKKGKSAEPDNEYDTPPTTKPQRLGGTPVATHNPADVQAHLQRLQALKADVDAAGLTQKIVLLHLAKTPDRKNPLYTGDPGKGKLSQLDAACLAEAERYAQEKRTAKEAEAQKVAEAMARQTGGYNADGSPKDALTAAQAKLAEESREDFPAEVGGEDPFSEEEIERARRDGLLGDDQ